jgi:hypothetical protein
VLDPSHVLSYEPLQIWEDLTYEEKSIQVLDSKYKVRHSMKIVMIKVLWSNHNTTRKASWGT